jgi:hypothetical protein
MQMDKRAADDRLLKTRHFRVDHIDHLGKRSKPCRIFHIHFPISGYDLCSHLYSFRFTNPTPGKPIWRSLLRHWWL